MKQETANMTQAAATFRRIWIGDTADGKVEERGCVCSIGALDCVRADVWAVCGAPQPAEVVRTIGCRPGRSGREGPRAKRALRKIFGISMAARVLLALLRRVSLLLVVC
jgi:hypothetical protein